MMGDVARAEQALTPKARREMAKALLMEAQERIKEQIGVLNDRLRQLEDLAAGQPLLEDLCLSLLELTVFDMRSAAIPDRQVLTHDSPASPAAALGAEVPEGIWPAEGFANLGAFAEYIAEHFNITMSAVKKAVGSPHRGSLAVSEAMNIVERILQERQTLVSIGGA